MIFFLFLFYSRSQYIFINIPSLSPLEWHPFSIATSPTDLYPTLFIKDMGYNPTPTRHRHTYTPHTPQLHTTHDTRHITHSTYTTHIIYAHIHSSPTDLYPTLFIKDMGYIDYTYYTTTYTTTSTPLHYTLHTIHYTLHYTLFTNTLPLHYTYTYIRAHTLIPY